MKTIDEKIKDMRAKLNPEWQCQAQREFAETIQAAAIAVFGITRAEFFGKSRVPPSPYARLASIAVCRERTRLSPNEIAALHNTDRSMVQYAVRKCANGKQWLIDGKAEVERLVVGYPDSKGGTE